MKAKRYWQDEDLTGVVFERLTVVEFDGKKRYGKQNNIASFWKCRCECDGKEISVLASRLKSGNTRSCGCLQYETRVRNGIKWSKNNIKSTENDPVAARNAAFNSMKGAA